MIAERLQVLPLATWPERLTVNRGAQANNLYLVERMVINLQVRSDFPYSESERNECSFY